MTRPHIAALLVWLAFCAPAAANPPGPPWLSRLDEDHPLVGRIWAPAEARFLTPDEVTRRLAEADLTLLGEHHDNPDHHRLQAWALASVIAAGRQPVVAFEMILPSQEAALTAHRLAHPDDVEALPTVLDWSASHWPEWSWYRPLFAEAMAAGLVIRSANLPNDLVRSLARRQPQPAEVTQRYRLDTPVDAADAEAMAEEIRQSHCGQMPEKVIPGMVDVQRARDAAMALAMTEAAPAGAVLIAGGGHTRTDRGVPALLRRLAPGRRVFSLAFLEVDEDITDPAAYGEPLGSRRPPFDAIWFTPRANDDDLCAGLADFLKRKQEKEKDKSN
ncbi:MAG TPA: ChaN family lipoprotein [Rhodospirillaceae bacterium]|nr:ChaN family lipoprotein [Rhodospirillaceae bacterium]